MLPGIPNCCPNFENGSGNGFNIGLLLDYELPYSLRTGIRAGIKSLNNKLSTIEPTLVRIDSDTSVGKFEHSIEATILDLSFEPYLTYNPIFGLNLKAGFSFGYLLTKNFHQKEKIVEPADRGVYVKSGTRVSIDTSGIIPNANDIVSFIFAGIGYELPLNKDGSLMIVPEAHYYMGLSNIVREVNWKINSFSAGLSIVYTPPNKKKVILEKHLKEVFIDTITIEGKEITQNKIITGNPVISNRTQKTEDTVFFVETLKRTDTSFIQPRLVAKLDYKEPEITLSVNFSSTSFPVLPVVFFEKMSDNIDNYYSKIDNKNSFSIESLQQNPLVFHQNILNIIGKRMEQYPASTIQLRGYVDFERENKDCNLALKRAEEIKDYLTNVWKIDERRIEILNGSSNCFPENVPSDKSDSAFAENRRVEILSSNPEIIASLTFKEPIDTAVSFSKQINYNWDKSTIKGLDNWELETVQAGKLIFHDGNPSGSFKLIEQNLDSSVVSGELKGEPLEANLIIRDINGREASDKKKINFNKIIKENDKHIVFSILFGLADDRLSNKVKSEMNSFVEKLETAKVKITGFSDIIGGEKKNRMLSANRAKNSADLIRSINPKLDIISIKSYSYDKFPPGITSYALPSERYLARTVLVEIIK